MIKCKLIRNLFTLLIVFTMFTSNISVLAEELPKTSIQPKNAQNVIVNKFPERFNLGGHLPAPFTNRTWNFEHIYNVDTGAPLYCVEFGIMANQGPFVHDETLQWGNFSDVQQDLLKDVLLYGFTGAPKYGFSWDIEYKATQVMTWIITTGYYNTVQESAIISEFSKSNGNILNAYNSIKNKMNNHEIIPSFTTRVLSTSPLYTMTHVGNGVHEIILTDTNNLLDQFNFALPSGVTSQRISHNQLKISTSNRLDGNNSLTSATKIETINAPGLVFLVKQGEQTKMSPRGISDPVRSYFRLQTTPLGNLKITKTSEDKLVSGLQFSIKGADAITSSYQSTHTTNAQGIIQVNNLIPGLYEVREINVPSKYIEPSVKFISVIDNTTQTISFVNNLKKGNLNIIKTSEDSVVNGLQFRVRGLDSNNQGYNVVHTTNANGQIAVNNILPGRYEVSEVNTPVRYNQPQSQIVTVSYNQTATVRFNNTLKKGKLKITKTDEDSGASLSGVEFSIYSKTTNKLIEVITTNQNGVAVSSDLVYGSYYFKETKHRQGYLPNTKVYDFSITTNGQVVNIDVKNKKQYGKVSIYNYGEDIDYFDFVQTELGKVYSPVYKEVPMRESVFSLYAKEDIVGADGIKYYSKDELVEKIQITDGKAATNKLILGEYYVKQDIVDQGHYIGENYGEFNLLYDETKDLIEEEKEFKNILQRINIDVELDESIPTDEEINKDIVEKDRIIRRKIDHDKTSNEEKLEEENNSSKVISSDITSLEDGKLNTKIEKQLKYGIYSKEDIKDRDGNVVLSNGNLIELVTFNNRLAKINSNLPFGIYNLKTIALAENIVESKEIKDISFTPQPSNIKEVFEKREQSYIMPTKQIEILKKAKYSQDILDQGYEEEVLEGAEFEIYKVYSDGEKLIETLVTDENGKSLSSKLTYGEYILRETQAPFGFLPLEEDIPFKIDNSSPLILEQLIENYPRIGSIRWSLELPIKRAYTIEKAHKVNEEESNTEVVKPIVSNVPTGDTITIILFVVLCVISLSVIIFVYLNKKKYN